MINRTLLRTKSVQVLYSMYVKQNLDLVMAESEINMSARKSYDLYHYILLLMVEIHRAAYLRNDMINNRKGETRGQAAIADRFINNRFIGQLAENRALLTYAGEEKLSWAENQDVVKNILNSVLASDYYAEYISAETDSYQADKDLWRKILKQTIINSDDFDNTLEDNNIYWYTGFDLIIEFIIKTIKNFKEENQDEQELLPMFDKEKGEDLNYAVELIDHVLLHSGETDEAIKARLNNWELERIPTMDKVILKCALAEMSLNALTPRSIIINEYVEIAKYFSSPKSANFVNGVLDKMK